ncbi:alpha/beta fold hydrolase [Aquimarina sp. M1]
MDISIVSTAVLNAIEEPCPATDPNLRGYYFPNENQQNTLFSVDGRLNQSFRDGSFVQPGDATGTLASAAVFQLVVEGAATTRPGFGGAENPDIPIAIADLAVSGTTNLGSFRGGATVESGGVFSYDINALKGLIFSGMDTAATRMAVTLPAEEAVIRSAIDTVVNRALTVVWALHGPVGYREGLRPGLGWIAVDAENDQPSRPVNVPAADWATRDLVVGVTHNDSTVNCRTRYAIAGADDTTPLIDIFNNIPETNVPPEIPDDAMVVVFLHGHSSSIEEGYTFYEHLINSEASCLARPLVMIAFDYPSNGYAQYLDHDVISPLDTTTRFVPDRPLDRRFGILEYYEAFTVSFVEELDRMMVAYGGTGILNRIAALIGGSMGGNLALRLSEKLVTNPTWLTGLVSWSPASSYVSFGRKDYFIPSPGEHIDIIGKEAIERTRIRCTEAENDEARQSFVALQLAGERIINDGTPGFEAVTRLISVLAQPLLAALVGGFAPFIPFVGGLVAPLAAGLTGSIVFGSSIFEGVANTIAIKQSDTWLSELKPECRDGWEAAVASRAALAHLLELYSANRRRMHWRVAYEQLLFSHQDEIAASRGVPCYEASTIPTLLIGGENDVVDDQTGFNIYKGVQFLAPRMINNPGKAIYAADTGHSMHVERPKFLAAEIHEFICGQYADTVTAVRRERGSITELYFGPMFKTVSIADALEDIKYNRVRYYVASADGTKNSIYIKRYLTTAADDTTDNNLRSLPESTLPSPPPEGSLGMGGLGDSFQVTHIRIRGSRRTPWESWVSYVCNDELEIQIPIQMAEFDIEQGSRRYYIHTTDGDNELRLVEYLTTYPNDDTEDNLSSLPEIEI